MFASVLFYTNKVKQMKRFYTNVLEWDMKESSAEQFTVKAGDTDITFKHTDSPAYYHFAINIPGNQFVIMKQWIRDRMPLLQSRGVTETYYQKLGADSMYFEDPGGNTVELIGRRNRDLFGPLTKEAFFDVSEVGITTPYVYEVGEELQDMGIPLLRGAEVNKKGMNYLGRDDAYIVLVPSEWTWEFSKKKAETHPLEITFTDGRHIAMSKEGLIEVSEEKAD